MLPALHVTNFLDLSLRRNDHPLTKVGDPVASGCQRLLDFLYEKLFGPPRQKLVEFRLGGLDNLIL